MVLHMNTITLGNFLNELCADEMSVLSLMIERKLKPTIEAKTSNHRVIQREHKLGSKVMCRHYKQYYTNKNGYTKIGRQKYCCKPCDLSFSDTTGTITFHSKKFYKHWHAFCGNDIYQLPLRKSAALLLQYSYGVIRYMQHLLHLKQGMRNNYLLKVKHILFISL